MPIIIPYNMRTALHTICFLLLQYLLFSQDSIKIEEFNTSIREANTIESQIGYLTDFADYQFDHCYNMKCFDSLSFLAIGKAEETYDDALKLNAIIEYLNSIGLEYKHDALDDHIHEAEKLAAKLDDDDLKLKTWLAISNAYLHSYDQQSENQYEKAKDYSTKCNGILNIDNHQDQILVDISLGNSYSLLKNKIDAFEYYMIAKLKIESLEYNQIYYEKLLLEALYKFYSSIYEIEKAENCKLELIEKLDTTQNDYEAKLKWHEFDLDYLKLYTDENLNIEKDIIEPLSYAEKTHNVRLKDFLLSLYKTYLLGKEDYKGFYSAFNGPYKNFIKSGKKKSRESEISYYHDLGYFNQHIGHIDSVIYYFDIAGDKAELLNKPHRLANHYYRYGDLLLKNKLTTEAIDNYKRGLAIASKSEFTTYEKIISKKLYELSREIGDYKLAIEYLEQNTNASKAEDLPNIKLKIALKTVKYDEKIQTQYLDNERQNQKQKQNFQYILIVISVTITILLLVLLSSLTVPKWVIKMLGFFNILLLFEFVILIIDSKLHHWTHGNPLPMFVTKVAILSFLFPLHHYIEHVVVKYMLEHNLIRRPSKKSIRQFCSKLWPWLDSDKEEA